MTILIGDDGVDMFDDTFANDTLRGMGGNDHLHSNNGGSDMLDGGVGDDHLWVIRGSAVIGSVTLSGGDGDDSISTTGWGTEVVVAGGAGADEISIHYANGAKVLAGNGADHVILDYEIGSNSVSLGGGSDTLTLGAFFNANFLDWTLVKVKDFTMGAGGDVLDLQPFLANHGWDVNSDPFDEGFVRLHQKGANVMVQVDLDGGGDHWTNLLKLSDASRFEFTADNFARDALEASGWVV